MTDDFFAHNVWTSEFETVLASRKTFTKKKNKEKSRLLAALQSRHDGDGAEHEQHESDGVEPVDVV
jgi:hypothetical protein